MKSLPFPNNVASACISVANGFSKSAQCTQTASAIQKTRKSIYYCNVIVAWLCTLAINHAIRLV